MMWQKAKIERGSSTVEVILLAILTLAGAASERLLILAALAGIIFFLLRILWLRPIHLDWSIDIPVLALLIIATLSTLWVTSVQEISTVQLFRLMGGIGLFYAVSQWGRGSRRNLLLLSLGFVVVGFLLSIAALFTVEWIQKFSFIPAGVMQLLAPVLSDTIHPNVMAGSLVLILSGLVAGLAFGWSALRSWQRILLALVGLWMAGILVMTQSRGALLGLGVSLLLIVVLRFRYGWIAGLVCLALITGLILAFGPSRVISEISMSEGAASSVNGRLEIWSHALYMIGDFPITGVGIGTFTEVADTFYPFFSAEPGIVTHAHNLFLQIAVDMGLPGLIAWLALWGAVIGKAWKVFRAGSRSGIVWQMALGAALLAAQVAMGVHGLLDAVTWGTRPAILIWALWGLALAAEGLLMQGLKKPVEE